MSAREFSLIGLVCLIWGFHLIFLKAVADTVPPIFYVAMRMTLVALLLSPFLRWRPDQFGKLIAAGVCLGGFHLALILKGLSITSASAASVAAELYTPFATVLAIFFLGEKIGWRRGLGIALAFSGVAIIALGEAVYAHNDSAHEGTSFGLLFIIAGVFIEACGSIFLKKIKGLTAIEIAAFMALVGSVLLWTTTLTFETGQMAVLQSPERNRVFGVLLYSAVGASIIGHTTYYWLLRRLPIAMVAPTALIATVISVIASVVFLGEPATPTLIAGSLIAMLGVSIIVFRSGGAAPAFGARGFFFFRRGFRKFLRNGRRVDSDTVDSDTAERKVADQGSQQDVPLSSNVTPEKGLAV